VTAASLATWNYLQPNAKLTAGKKMAELVPSKEARSVGAKTPKRTGSQEKKPAKPAAKAVQRTAQR
jgi:hypothetical protein